MRLRDFGPDAPRSWFQQILEWSRKKITIDDNLDCQILSVNIGTSATEIGHSLGRTPRYVLEVAAYPNGTAGISFALGKEPKVDKIWLTRSTAGQCTIILF